jgi:phage tail tape-measure protein
VFEGLFDKTKDTDKYRDEAKRASFGEAIRGSGGQILENLSALYPQQHSPMFIPGETSQGFGGIIGTVAGAALGSIVPGVGTALGAKVGGGIGSMF